MTAPVAENTSTLLTSGLLGLAVGAIVGGMSKFVWELWLPGWLTWKREQRVQRQRLLSEQRDHAVRAINELRARLWVTITSKAHNYEYTKELGRESYYVESTAFLIAQYFAWSEVMREYIAALDYRELSILLDEVSESFSHGNPGFQFFRLEQREIGERLFATRSADATQTSFRYADFVDMVSRPDSHESMKRLIKTTRQLFQHLEREVGRASSIHNALVRLLDFVDPEKRWVPEDRRERLPEQN